MSGFLIVNMDGFHSNCVDDTELTQIFGWDGLDDLLIKTGENSSIIALQSAEGELTIEDQNSPSLKVVHNLYQNVWSEVVEEFKDAPTISWTEVESMGIKRKSFKTFDEAKETTSALKKIFNGRLKISELIVVKEAA